MLRLFFIMLALGFSMPVHANFDDLRDALEDRLQDVKREIRRTNDDGVEFPKINLSRNVLKQGQTDSNLPLLRAKLIDYTPDDVPATDPYYYDDILVEAVRSFQRSMRMKDDGVIGPQTLSVINRTLDDERKQIEVNLYRLEQPELLGRPDLRIDVDIARYNLTAYENGKVEFEMPVVVGSKKRQTNRFSTVMTGIRLNPGWTLPPTIKEEDYIPKLRSDPEWVTNKGVQVYSSWDRNAEPIDPTTIDWNYLTDNEIKAMRFYKNAGSSNPLGLYRFLMNNQYDIYLHDTNQKYLFDRSARAKSSGCVRVSDPRKITEFLLKDNPDWTSEKIDDVLDGGKTYNVGAKRSIPVYFDYKTAWLDSTGALVLGYDIYDLDDLEYSAMIKVQGNQTTLVE
jgi:murein L,D-transpeptidase YcbB/YkuD